ncbi:MAG: hypothetical protein WDN00_06170 [Limisphaerales bacterium]
MTWFESKRRGQTTCNRFVHRAVHERGIGFDVHLLQQEPQQDDLALAIAKTLLKSLNRVGGLVGIRPEFNSGVTKVVLHELQRSRAFSSLEAAEFCQRAINSFSSGGRLVGWML